MEAVFLSYTYGQILRFLHNYWWYNLGHEDFVFGEAELLSTEGDVAHSVRLLHLAGGEAALMVHAAHEQGLAIFRLTAGERAGRHVGATSAHPVVGAANQHLENKIIGN